VDHVREPQVAAINDALTGELGGRAATKLGPSLAQLGSFKRQLEIRRQPRAAMIRTKVRSCSRMRARGAQQLAQALTIYPWLYQPAKPGRRQREEPN
jgi:hypothetical protein